MITRIKSSLALSFVLLLMPMLQTASGAERYDPTYTISALNMAVVSIHKIIAAEDRIVLDFEYKNIINNLNLGNIEDDPELKELYKTLLDAIGNKTLRQKEAARVTDRYDAREKNRFVNILSYAHTNDGNPWSFVGSLIAGEVTAYFGASKFASDDRDELDDELWKLERQNIEEYASLQKNLLDASWTLLRRYNLPDEYRLAQQDLDAFDMAVSEKDLGKSLRMFKALEINFRMYAPFWYYYATAADAAGETEMAKRCLDEFEHAWRPVLRHDPFRAETAKHRARELSEAGAPRKDVACQLKIVENNTPRENWINNLYAGVMYYSIGEREKAVERVSVNLDFDIEHEISEVVLRNMKEGKLDVGLFSDSIQSILVASRRGYQEKRRDAEAERGLIAWFRNETDTAFRLMRNSLNGPAASDPLPYHVLSNIIETTAAARKNKPSATPLLDMAWLRKARDDTAKAAPEISYEALLPIVKRYASEGSSNAKIFLGDMYFKGLGVKSDASEAAKIFKGPAELGVAHAQGMLGEIFETDTILKDETEAVKYYARAANQGLPWAATRLGDMCGDGRGVGQKNLEDAYMWYSVALMVGDPTAQSRIDDLEGKGLLKMKSVSGTTVHRAKERAREIYEGFSDVKP
jgi:TPR repeat protein